MQLYWCYLSHRYQRLHSCYLQPYWHLYLSSSSIPQSDSKHSLLVYFTSSLSTPTSHNTWSSIRSYHNFQNMSCFCLFSFSHMQSPLLKCSFSPGICLLCGDFSDSGSLLNYFYFQVASNKFGSLLSIYNLLPSVFWHWHQV